MLMPWTHRVALQQREVAMRPARIIAAVVFAAAIAVTGCAAHSTAAHPSPAPAPLVVDQPPAPPIDLPAAKSPTPAPKVSTPAPKSPTPAPKSPNPPIVNRVPVPVLADGRYDAYIRQVNTRGDYLVVDLVQVFHDQAAVEAAIADGRPRDTAQYLSTYVRNQNPRLRTLPLAGDLRVDLLGSCEEPVSHQLNKLAADARLIDGAVHTYYFTLTVAGGAVHRVQEFLAINAC
jgi:hypothetical protein